VNTPQTEEEEKALLDCIRRGRPFGDDSWVRRMAEKLNLGQTLRPRGRPTGWRKGAKPAQEE
jgi:putative transposase